MPIPGRPITRLRAALSAFSNVNTAVQEDRQQPQDPRLAELANLTPGQRRGRGLSLPTIQSETLAPLKGQGPEGRPVQLSDAVQIPAEEEKKPGLFKRFTAPFKTEEGRSSIFGLAGAISSAAEGTAAIAKFAETQRAEIRQKDIDATNKTARDIQIGQRERELKRLDRAQKVKEGEAKAKLPPIRTDQNTGQNVFLTKDPKTGEVIQTPVSGSVAKKAKDLDQLQIATLQQKSGELALQKANVRLTELLKDTTLDPFKKAQLEQGVQLIQFTKDVAPERKLAAMSFAFASVMSLFLEEDRFVINTFRNEHVEALIDGDVETQNEQRVRNLVFGNAQKDIVQPRLDVIDTPDSPAKKAKPTAAAEPEKPTIRATATVNGIKIRP